MNIRNITLKQLRLFSSVAKLGSVTKAADALFITKSAASMTLQDLEQQLGKPLFDRQKNRLVLNHQGHHLLPLADELLQRVETISMALEDQTLSGQLRIGASNTVGNHLLPGLLAGFMRRYRTERPELLIRNTSLLAERLEKFELDIAFVEGRIEQPKLISQLWLTDRMLIIASPQHPLADGQPHQLSELEQQAWVMREASSGTREQFNQLLHPSLRSWKLALEINTNEAVVNAVAAGLGLGFISNLAAYDAIKAGRIGVIELHQPIERQLYMVYHRDKYLGPLLEQFSKFSQQWQPNDLI